jgi:hypothetical protein
MRLEEKRFVDNNATLGWYGKEVFCVCPNCNAPLKSIERLEAKLEAIRR